LPLDNDLLLKITEGDELAFKQFFEYYVKKVYQFTLGYVKHSAEAQDITQTVFIKIWEKRSDINFSQSIDGFVFTIAYRTIIDAFRRSSSKFPEKNRRELSDDMASSNRSDDLLHAHHLESLYEKSLSNLPPKRKEIFILSRHFGLSNREIGERLGLSVKTVENQMTSALATLRRFFYNSDLIPAIILFLFY
jgi:RNA polymerase sigma-70 factor (ECF subfamily)